MHTICSILVITILGLGLTCRLASCVDSNTFTNTASVLFSGPSAAAAIPDSQLLSIVATENFQSISQSEQKFGLNFFTNISNSIHRAGMRRDFMVSPFAVWSLLVVLLEGASGNTLEEMRNVLYIDSDLRKLRDAYRVIQSFFNYNTSTIEMSSLQAIFTDINQPILRDFENIIDRFYGSQLRQLDFKDAQTTSDEINNLVRISTRGFIKHAILPQDLKDANLFMLSSLFFKAHWKHPFDAALTRPEVFYDEDGSSLGYVDVMVQKANFRYATISELEGHVLELPYGKQDRLAMIIILPKKGVRLHNVVERVKQFGIEMIFKHLANVATPDDFEDDEVEVLLPKFETTTDLSLEGTLKEMGIYDVFHANATLSKLSDSRFSVTNILHTTKIIVDEKGTIAAAIAGATLVNKATPPKFYLNRPFIYFIIEKSTKFILFSGQIMNPNNLPKVVKQ